MQNEKPALSRRLFLNQLSRAGGAAAVYGGLSALGLISPATAYAGPPALASDSGRGLHVAVLGGGIAGLVAAHELRKAGYRVSLLEARDRPGGRVFSVRRGSVIEEIDSLQKVKWDAGADLFFDAGAARLPQHHQGILSYARDFKVRLEVLSNQNRHALLQSSAGFQGQALRASRVNAEARGLVAELAAKAVDQATLARPLSAEDKEKLRAFLREFGALDNELKYRGSPRSGFREPPGAGQAAGIHHDPLDLEQLFRVNFWSQLYQSEENPTQLPTMLRPIGGMAKISEAMARSLSGVIRYGAEVQSLRRRGEGVRISWRDTKTQRRATLDADYAVVTIQPGLLGKLDQDFSPHFQKALAAPTETPLAKVAFQATRRFWELDDQIYGGISWTDHPIRQIWYPSQGIHAQKGILLGAYILQHGEQVAQASLAERLELALAGGELLHPGKYRKHLEHGVSISWRKAKYSSGATTRWSEEARAQQYPVLLEADGPYYFAGEYLSYVNGWQEGAVRSAHHALERLSEHARTRPRRNEKKA